MICDPCKAGDHCERPGPVGLRSGSCGCQHRPPGAWKGVQVIAEIKTDPVPADVAARQLAAYVDAYSAGPQNIRRLSTPEKAARHLAARMDVPPVPLTARPRVFVHQVADVDPALIAGCNDQSNCCPDDACKLDAARAAANLPQRTTAPPHGRWTLSPRCPRPGPWPPLSRR